MVQHINVVNLIFLNGSKVDRTLILGTVNYEHKTCVGIDLCNQGTVIHDAVPRVDIFLVVEKITHFNANSLANQKHLQVELIKR